MVRELGIGGCERDLTKLAIGLDRSRFEPHVGCLISDGMRGEELRRHGVPVVRFDMPSLFSTAAVRAARQMGRYLKEHRIQLVQAFDAPMDGWGLLSAWVHRTPVIISSTLFSRTLFPLHDRVLMRITDRLADRIVINSKAAGQELSDHEGVAAGRTFLSYNGVETEKFNPGDRWRTNLDSGPVTIGAVCALRREKRMDLLVEAFAEVHRARPDTRLLIVGSGVEETRIRQRADELGVAGAVRLEPGRPDVVEALRAIDIFVMASDSESFPNALLEAMACGCCPVGSRVGGVPELIEENVSGLIFEPGNAAELAARLTTLLNDPSLRLQFAGASAQRARERFSMDAAIARMQGLYSELLEERFGRVATAGAGAHESY
jgi:glycosyltransferase involved in cell wall biosynthesis